MKLVSAIRKKFRLLVTTIFGALLMVSLVMWIWSYLGVPCFIRTNDRGRWTAIVASGRVHIITVTYIVRSRDFVGDFYTRYAGFSTRCIDVPPDLPRAPWHLGFGVYHGQYELSGPVHPSQPSFESDPDTTATSQQTVFDYARVTIPLWSPFLLGALPMWALLQGPIRRRRRAARGLCLRCGYDLRQNTSGRCPECGTAVASAGRNEVGSV